MVGSRSEVVLSMLPDSAALAASVLGRDGLAEGLSPGSTLVEMSTTDIDIVIRIDEALSAKECAILDAPVSGTPDMVAGRDLTMWE
jgi:3-hydroxyisobutyrate dehydrogenase